MKIICMKPTMLVLLLCGAISSILLSKLASGATTNPAAYRRSDNVNSVVYRGIDDHIHELYLPLGRSWLVDDLSRRAGAPLAAGDPFGYIRCDSVNSVVYRGIDKHIHELYLEGSNWLVGDLSAKTGAPQAAGDPAAYCRSDDVSSVVYRGIDNDIHELYLPLGGSSWLQGDLSLKSGGAPAAAGNPAAYRRSDNVNSVLYRGFDDDIHELYLPLGGSRWLQGDLSFKAGAPAAAGNPAACVRSDGVNHVVYRGFDNDIHELYLEGGNWLEGDLSFKTGAPPAAGDPATYRRSDNVNSVVYRGLDNDINELYLPLGGSWLTGNLSDLTGAPPANR
jgi:hypothetical protein